MRRLFILVAISAAMLMGLFPSSASINLNSSRSNVYRLVYDANVVSQAQGDALAKALDQQGPLTEAKAKAWMVNNFKTFGIDGTRIKVIRVLLQRGAICNAPADSCKGKWVGPNLNARMAANAVCYCYEPVASPLQVGRVSKTSPIRILLLNDAADEPQALAVSDPGKQGVKGTKDVP